MTEEQIAALAKVIAQDIFECGNEPGRKTTRIAYISGKYGVDEQSMGGSCLDSLEGIIETTLRRVFDSKEPA
jgi:hypothetical protein